MPSLSEKPISFIKEAFLYGLTESVEQKKLKPKSFASLYVLSSRKR